jgi:hypothetical protein
LKLAATGPLQIRYGKVVYGTYGMVLSSRFGYTYNTLSRSLYV